jgi:hypothetical protein
VGQFGATEATIAAYEAYRDEFQALFGKSIRYVKNMSLHNFA